MKTSSYNKYRSANSRPYKTVAVTVFVLLILGSAFLIYNSMELSNIVDRVRLDNEKLISEKIHLNRSLDEVRKEVAVANEKYREISQVLESTRDRVDKNQKEFRRLTQQLDSLSLYRIKCDDLQRNNRDLEQKISKLIKK